MPLLERSIELLNQIRQLKNEPSSMPADPVEWTEQYRILNGEPWSFQDRDYLLPIYRDNHPRILIAKARQMEVTEWLANRLLHRLILHPFTTAIYTAPRMDQVSRFSRDRFRKAILTSPQLRPRLQTRSDIELGEPAITRVPFTNGSVCYLLSAWGEFDALRNIPADFVAVDEIQDIQTEALPVVEEAMSHSKYAEAWLVGTASDVGSEFSRMWESSDMKEWDGKAWIPSKPENHDYSSYHIDQRMAPWLRNLPPTDHRSIEYKRSRYPERRFLNEVLGLFHKGLRKPLLVDDLVACRDLSSSLLEGLSHPRFSYLGVDWGAGEHTVVWIFERLQDGRFRTIYVRKMDEKDPMKQIDIVARLMELFNVKQGVGDIGYGAIQVSELQKKFGPRFYGCLYVRRPQIPLARKEKDESGQKISQMIVEADRSFWIETVIDMIKRRDQAGNVIPQIVIPWQDPLAVEWIVDQFTCLEAERIEEVSGRKYTVYSHPEGEPDHAAHACVYATIAESIERVGFGPVDLGKLGSWRIGRR